MWSTNRTTAEWNKWKTIIKLANDVAVFYISKPPHLELLQGTAERFDRFHVEVISRLIKDEEIWTVTKT